MIRVLIFILMVLSFFSYAQEKNNDTIINTQSIIFSSINEENIIKEYFNKKSVDDNFLELLFSIDSTYLVSKYKNDILSINTFLGEIKIKSEKYNDKKKVKYIFNQIHSEFFKKYDLNSYFSDIFKTSTYNCVTATALYAYAFDYFNIPYQIKETPVHVFLVAYPNTLNVYVETTNPSSSGFYAPSENLIKKAVDELVELKVITKEKVLSEGYNKAFNDYYYGDGNIDKVDIVGIQYYNKSVFFFNEKSYENSYININKSKLFYKTPKVNLFSELLLDLIIDTTDFEDIDNFKWFIEYSNVSKDYDFLEYKLTKIISEDNWGEKMYNIIEEEINSIEKEDVKHKLLERFYSFLAERYQKLQFYKKTLEYAIKVYDINPNSLNAKNFISKYKISSLAQKNISEQSISNLKEIIDEYPFIAEFGVYDEYRIILYSYMVSTNFNNNKPNKGLLYLDDLEGLISDKKEEINYNEGAVGTAYASIGAYYYRNKNKSKAIEYLRRGLKNSPNNQNINRKLNLIKNSY